MTYMVTEPSPINHASNIKLEYCHQHWWYAVQGSTRLHVPITPCNQYQPQGTVQTLVTCQAMFLLLLVLLAMQAISHFGDVTCRAMFCRVICTILHISNITLWWDTADMQANVLQGYPAQPYYPYKQYQCLCEANDTGQMQSNILQGYMALSSNQTISPSGWSHWHWSRAEHCSTKLPNSITQTLVMWLTWSHEVWFKQYLLNQYNSTYTQRQ